jgi:hypothetical protein
MTPNPCSDLEPRAKPGGSALGQRRRRMRIATAWLATILTALISSGASGAQRAPVSEAWLVAKAEELLTKKIGEKQQIELGETPLVRTEDWSFGFTPDDPGLMRYGSSAAVGDSKIDLSVEQLTDARCPRARKTGEFGLNVSFETYKLKGPMATGQYADAWVTFADKNVYDAQSRKIKMDFSQNSGQFSFALDPAELGKRGQLAICPSAKPPGAQGDLCARFSLKGFARAYAFACDAK